MGCGAVEPHAALAQQRLGELLGDGRGPLHRSAGAGVVTHRAEHGDGIESRVFHGRLNAREKAAALADFKESARVLIASRAGAEGLNIQFCSTVLNFDLYGSLGAGIVSKRNYVATYDEAATEEQRAVGDIMALQFIENEVKVAPSIGLGATFFLNQFMALKLDARSAFYVDNKPQYDPDIPVAEQRLYNNFVMSAGLGFFFPKMKPRLYVY